MYRNCPAGRVDRPFYVNDEFFNDIHNSRKFVFMAVLSRKTLIDHEYMLGKKLTAGIWNFLGLVIRTHQIVRRHCPLLRNVFALWAMCLTTESQSVIFFKFSFGRVHPVFASHFIIVLLLLKICKPVKKQYLTWSHTPKMGASKTFLPSIYDRLKIDYNGAN